MKDNIGRDVYDHLNGVGSQSLRCLLPIFDPDWVGHNPLDFSPFHRARFKDESLKTSARTINETNFIIHSWLISASLRKYRSGAALRLCVK